MFRSKVLLVCALLITLFAIDAFAGASFKTRSKCRWWSKKYVANAVTGCYLPVPYVNCAKHSFSCGTATAICEWKSCINGIAYAYASNGLSGYRLVTRRYGWAFAGRDDIDSTIHSESILYGQVEYDSIGLNIIIHIDSGQLAGAMDSSYAILEIKGFTNADSTDTLVTPENTFWSGSIVIQYGAIASVTGGLTLDGMVFDPATGVLEVVNSKIVTIPFSGSVEEFAYAGVQVQVDVGYGDPAPVVTGVIPTLTEWGMIIFSVLLFGWMARVMVRRRRSVSIRM